MVSPHAGNSPYNTGVTYIEGTDYIIKVISSNGNVKVGLYPLPESSSQEILVATVAKGVGSLVMDIPTFAFRFFFNSDYPLGLINQSGFRVNGYPAFCIPKTVNMIFAVDISNADPNKRDIYLNYQTLLSLGGSPGSNKYYIIKNVTFSDSGSTIIPLARNETIHIQYKENQTLYFSPSSIGGDSSNPSPTQGPYGITILFFGHYTGNRPYAQTIPIVATQVSVGSIITDLSPSSGGSGTVVNVQGKTFTASLPMDSIMVTFLDKDGGYTAVGSGKTTPGGSLDSTSFIVPSNIKPGYYTIMVSDGINTAFSTFYYDGT
jgi:hypothetical protein